MTNSEIRRRYKSQLARIGAVVSEMREGGASLEEQAIRAFGIRQDARKAARDMMEAPEEMELLRRRDKKKYGHPDGPTFEELMAQHLQDGLTTREAYQAIIESAQRSDKATDAKILRMPGETPT